MMGHMPYTLRSIVKQHCKCQLDLHYMLPEVLPEVMDNYNYVNIMIGNVNILFILVLRFHQGVK